MSRKKPRVADDDDRPQNQPLISNRDITDSFEEIEEDRSNSQNKQHLDKSYGGVVSDNESTDQEDMQMFYAFLSLSSIRDWSPMIAKLKVTT